MMVKFAPLILKTLWRHRARTVLTVSGAAVGLFVFFFVGSIQAGLDNLLNQREAEQTLVVFQANKFCVATSNLPQDYAEKIMELPGVKDVVPIKVFTNNCRASLDSIVFHGMPAEKMKEAREFTLLSGSYDEFQQHQDAALVGRAVARRRGLEKGSKFSIGDYTVNVAGVVASDNAAEDNYIYTHLEFLQLGRGKKNLGTVTQLEVILHDGTDPEAMCREIDDRLRQEQIETTTRPKGVFQAKTLGDVTHLIHLSRYLGYACLGLVLMLVATTTVMAVQDRVQEHAVLQTLGFSGSRVFTLVLTESTILGTVGGAIGVVAAMIFLVLNPMSLASDGVNLPFTPTMGLALTGLAVGFAAGVVAGLVPAWQAARTEIVPALRQA
jgi:putative ABC transport system permease protein